MTEPIPHSFRPTRSIAVLLFAVCAAWLGVAMPTTAQKSDLYTITVPVDATAANAAAARDKALAEGQRRAARSLFERLTAREDRARLPQLTDTDLRNLVRAFEVANERTSPVRYLADLTVVFDPNEVRAFLSGAGVALVGGAAPPRPVVVLPVWRTRDAVLLFNDRNPWFIAWQQHGAGNGVVPLIVPAGDVADIALITAQQALTGDRRALAAIAGKYGTDAVVVAIATYQAADGPPQLTIVRFDLSQERRIAIPVRPRAGDDPMLASAQAVALEIDENWKSQGVATAPADPGASQGQPPVGNSIGGIDGETLRATIPVRALYEWIAIRNRLAAVPAVRKVDVNSLVVGSADITITYAGTVPQLRAALAAVDLQLNEQGAEWVLRSRTPILPPGAAQPPVPAGAPGDDPGAAPGPAPSSAPGAPAPAPSAAQPPLPSIAPPASIGTPPGVLR